MTHQDVLDIFYKKAGINNILLMLLSREQNVEKAFAYAAEACIDICVVEAESAAFPESGIRLMTQWLPTFLQHVVCHKARSGLEPFGPDFLSRPPFCSY